MSKVAGSFLAAWALFAPLTAASQSTPRGTPAPSERQLAPASYALIKRPLRPVTRREALSFLLPGSYPARGIILAFGSFLDAAGYWTIVDFDNRTLERLRTTTLVTPDGKRKAVIDNKAGRPLSIAELNNVIEAANVVWNPSSPNPDSPPLMHTHSTCDVALFDGTDVFHDYGFVCPPETEHLVKLIGALKTPAPANNERGK